MFNFCHPCEGWGSIIAIAQNFATVMDPRLRWEDTEKQAELHKTQDSTVLGDSSSG